jgi:hypothetical protein
MDGSSSVVQLRLCCLKTELEHEHDSGKSRIKATWATGLSRRFNAPENIPRQEIALKLNNLDTP